MTHKDHDIVQNGSACIHLESLIRSDYERCHPGETLENLKHRARFSKEDKGLLRDWTVLAMRAIARHSEKLIRDFGIAA